MLYQILHYIFQAARPMDQIHIYGGAIQNEIFSTAQFPLEVHVVLSKHSSFANLQSFLLAIGEFLTFQKSYRYCNALHPFGQEPNTWEYEKESFSVVIHHGNVHKPKHFNTNQFVLTPHGLRIDTWLDLCNPTECISCIQQALNQQCVLHTAVHPDNDFNMFSIACEQIQLCELNQVQGFDVAKNIEDTCCICYDSPKEKMIFVLECTHLFCIECLDKHKNSTWLSTNHQCPICRNPIRLATQLEIQLS